MASENKQVISYSKDDWEDLKKSFGIDFTPRVPQETIDDEIRHFLNLRCTDDMLDIFFTALFEIPYEDLPLHINDQYTRPDGKVVSPGRVINWRLRRGK